MIRDEDLEASGEKSASFGAKETDQRTVAEILDGEDGRPNEVDESDWPKVWADCQDRYDAAKDARNERLNLIQKGLTIGADPKCSPWRRPASIAIRLNGRMQSQPSSCRDIDKVPLQPDTKVKPRKRCLIETNTKVRLVV